jgi:hypothetical protein
MHSVALCTGYTAHHALDTHLTACITARVRQQLDYSIVADFETRALLAGLRVIAIAVEAHRTFAPLLSSFTIGISSTGPNSPRRPNV